MDCKQLLKLRIVQQLYVFFSRSPRRWNIFNTEASLNLSLKSLSSTRWSAHYEAVKALKCGYKNVLKTLKFVFHESGEKTDCKQEAKSLLNKLIKLEYAIIK